MTDAAFWDSLADDYSRKPVENEAAFEKKIAVTKSRLTPDSIVLDIGCGTGSLALTLAPNAAEVHGLDISSEMVRIARSTGAGVDNVTFHAAPFDDSFTVFDDASLDVICAYSFLHLADDRTAALQQIYRLLKPGGFFVSSTVCLGQSKLPYRPLLWAMRKLGKAPEVAIVDKAMLEADIKQAGFVDVEYPPVDAETTVVFAVARKPD